MTRNYCGHLVWQSQWKVDSVTIQPGFLPARIDSNSLFHQVEDSTPKYHQEAELD